MLFQQPFMNFEIQEKVKHFKDGQSFRDLSTLELQPIVKVQDSQNQVDISGYLVLNGEFLKKDENWEEQFEQADAIHYGGFFEKSEIETFQYQIPVSFQIHPERVKDISQVFLVVENFDYDIVSDYEMKLTANIKLIGVHPDVRHEKAIEQSISVEGLNFNQSEEVQEINNEDLMAAEEGAPVEEVQKEIFEVDVKKKQESKSKLEVENEDEKLETENLEVNKESYDSKEANPVMNEHEDVNQKIVESKNEEPVAKMKIGIQGKNRKSSRNEEVKKENPFSSLLKKNEKSRAEEIVTEEITHEAVKSEQVDSTRYENVEIKLEEHYSAEQEQDLNARFNQTDIDNVNKIEKDVVKEGEVDQSDTALLEDEGKNIKDMLFSLLQGNEENKYRMKIYLVQKEDTLENIAEKYDLKSDELLRHNKLENRELSQGQLLYLPIKR